LYLWNKLNKWSVSRNPLLRNSMQTLQNATNSPGFNHSNVRHSGIRGAVEKVFHLVFIKNPQKSLCIQYYRQVTRCHWQHSCLYTKVSSFRIKARLGDVYWGAESFQWFIEGQAFSSSYNLLPNPHSCHQVVSLSQFFFLCVIGRSCRGERGRGQIIRQRESLVLYKSFNSLWYRETGERRNVDVSWTLSSWINWTRASCRKRWENGKAYAHREERGRATSQFSYQLVGGAHIGRTSPPAL
jgi:hypothetical protein